MTGKSGADKSGLFRTREGQEANRVTNIELFFDLVFVFAVTQLSHRLLTHLDLTGAVETLILFLALWWLWIYTSWVTNWMNPDSGPVRATLIAMMLGALLMAVWLPGAFGESGGGFAVVYIAMQLGRTGAVIWASAAGHRDRMRNFIRIAFYFTLSAPFWLAGGFGDPSWRAPLWAIALAIEYAGPFAFFITPGIGRSQLSDWDISGAHMAERVSLFVIIALGEAIVVTGGTFAALTHSDNNSIAAFAVSFLASAAMWWVYFDSAAGRASKVMGDEDTNAGRLARDAYTYWHMPIVAGIVVTAVGDEMILAHPLAASSNALLWTAGGGTLLFLLGNLAFKWLTNGNRYPPMSHAFGLLLLALTLSLSASLDALGFGIAMLLVLAFCAMWEWVPIMAVGNAGRRGWGESSTGLTRRHRANGASAPSCPSASARLGAPRMPQPLILAVPKGRILADALPLMARAGIVAEAGFGSEDDRRLRFKTDRAGIELIRVRAFDVATFVAHGAAQLGIVGSDVIAEFDYAELYAPVDLGIGHCRVSVAEPVGLARDDDPKRWSHVRVATKYPNLTRRHFEARGVSAECVKLNGAMELAPTLGLADRIVDLVSTGRTLKDNGLVEVEVIAEVSARLIVNRSAFKTHPDVAALVEAFRGAIA